MSWFMKLIGMEDQDEFLVQFKRLMKQKQISDIEAQNIGKQLQELSAKIKTLKQKGKVPDTLREQMEFMQKNFGVIINEIGQLEAREISDFASAKRNLDRASEIADIEIKKAQKRRFA